MKEKRKKNFKITRIPFYSTKDVFVYVCIYIIYKFVNVRVFKSNYPMYGIYGILYNQNRYY